MLKRRGPRTEPWRTPEATSVGAEVISDSNRLRAIGKIGFNPMINCNMHDYFYKMEEAIITGLQVENLF